MEGRTLFRLALFAAIVVSSLVGSMAYCAEPSGSIEFRDISVKLTLLIRDGKISAREPVLARLEITNLSKEHGFEPVTYFEVRDGKGRVVAAMKKPVWPPSGEGDWAQEAQLGPGENVSGLWVISGLYRFEKPGSYSVHAQLLAVAEGIPVIAEDSAPILVLPRDAERLDMRCYSIYQPIRTHTSYKTDIPMEIRITMLYSVRDDVALPYLELMARDGYTDACMAIRRIGTKQAKTLFEEMLTWHNFAGIAARKIVNAPLKNTDFRWLMGH